MINPQKAVAWMREQNPQYNFISDENVYDILKDRYPQYDYPENPYFPDYTKDSPLVTEDLPMADHKTSPKEVNKLWESVSQFDLAEWGKEEGVPLLGLRPEAFKSAANENITGMIHQIATGELKYDVGDYSPNFQESVAEFFIGLANPVDALAFFGSSGVGALVGKPLLKKALSKKFFQEAMEGSVRKKLTKDVTTYGIAEAFTTGTIGLGSYMGAAGALGETAKQSMEMKNPEAAFQRYGPEVFENGKKNPNHYIERKEGEWDWGRVTKYGVKHGIEGAILGGITAGTGKAIGSKFSGWQAGATSKTGKTLAKVMNYPTQVAVEAGEFAFTPYIWNGMPDSWHQIAHDYAHSVGVIGPLKASNAFFRSSNAQIKEHMSHAKRLHEIRTEYKTKEKRALEGAKTNIEQNTEVGEKKSGAALDVDKAIDSALEKESKTLVELIETYGEMDKFLSRTVESLDKKDLTVNEIKNLMNDAPNAYNLMDGWYRHMKELEKTSPELYRQLTDNGRLEIKEDITKQVKKIRDSVNEKVSQPENSGEKPAKDFKDWTEEEMDRYIEKNIVPNIRDKQGEPEARQASRDLLEVAKENIRQGLETKENVLSKLEGFKKESPDFRKLMESPEGEKFLKDIGEIKVEKPVLPEEHIIGGVNLEEAKLDWGDAKVKSEAKKLGVDYKILKKEIVDRDKVIERIFKQDIAEEGKIKKGQEEQARLTAIHVLGFDIAETRKTAQQTIQTNKMSKKRYDELKGKVKGDDALAIAQFQSTSESKGKYAKPVGDFLIWLKEDTGKSLKDSTASDVHRYFQEVLLESPTKNKITSGDVAAFSNFDKWSKKKWSSDRIWEDISYTEANLNRYENVVDRHIPKNLAEHLIKNYEGAKTIVTKKWKGSTEKEFDFVYDLMHRGLRPSEINQLNKSNFKQHTDGTHYIDLTTSANKALKSQSGGRLQSIIIPEKLYKYGLKIDKSLFEIHGKGGKLLQNKTTNAKKSMQKLIAEKLTGDPNASVKDMRNAFEQLKISIGDKKLTQQELDMYLGHNISGQKIIYKLKNMDLPEALDIARRVEKALGIDSGSGKYQINPLGEATLDKSVKKFIERHAKRYPTFKIVYEQDKEYAGKFLKNTIYLTEGKANLQTFFHEVGHGFEAFIRGTKDKEMIKLWERGEKMFTKEAEKAGQSVNEYFTDRVSDYGVGMSLGVRNKMSNWAKLMMTKVKKFFFGKSNLNKRDIARLLGEKVYKGFGKENTILLGEKSKFQIKDKKKFAKQTRELFDTTMDKIIKNSDKLSAEALKAEKNEMIRYIADKSGMENPGEFTKISSSRTPEQLAAFYEYLVTPEIFKVKERTEISKFLRAKDQATTLRTALNIMPDSEKKILKNLGVKDGNIYNASSEQVKEYISWMDKSGLSKHIPKKDWIEEAVGEGILSRSDVAKYSKLAEIKGMSLPVQYVIKSLGLKPLADRLLNHSVKEMRHIGRAQEFENNISAILQTRGEKLTEREVGVLQLARGRKKFEKIKDFLYLFDEGRRIERIENNWLASKEKAFVMQSFEKNGKGGVIKGSVAELLKKEIDTYNEYIRTELEASVKANMNDAQFQEWKKTHNPKWIVTREGNSYVHRGLTKEFFEVYRPDSQAFERRIEAEGKKIAIKMAKDRNPGATEAEIKKASDKLLDAAEEMARAKFANSYEFSGSKFKTEFLMDRNRAKLPEKWFSEELGKTIDVYDTSYDRVFKKYQLGMGKALANMEYFPEHVNLKGITSPDVRKQITSLENSHGKWGRYVRKIVERQLNIGKREGVFQEATSTLRQYANFLAKTQLSFPTAGLKNALIGTYQSLYAFKMRQMAGGFLSSFNKQHRALVRAQGGTEIGLKHIDTYKGMFQGLVEKGFKFGLMRPTENLNRYAVVGAAHIDQAGLLKTLRRFDPTTRKYKKAYSRLNKFYELKESEIKKLNKYGLGGVDGLKREAVQRKQLSRELEHIYNKMDAMAHIKTQGATLDLYMPYWMGAGNAKALTLFKRMAYAASVNTANNMKAAVTEGNPMKIAVGTMGALASGEVLMTVYDKLLGQGKPAEDSPFWDRLLALLHRGEFLGIFSEWWNMNEEHAFEHTISPAIYNHAYDVIGFWSDFAAGERFLSDTVDKTFRGTVSSYNAMMKVWERKMSLEITDGKIKTKSQWFNKEQKDFAMKYREFLKLINPNARARAGEYERDTQTKYFERLKKAFNTGDEELFTRTYMAAFFSVYGEEAEKGKAYLGKGTYTDKQALERAYSRMKKYTRYLNPNKGSFIKEIFGFESEDETRQMYYQWMQHLHPDKIFKDYKTVNGKIIPFVGPNTSKNQARLLKAEAEYGFRYRHLFEQTGKNKGILKASLIIKHLGKHAKID